MKTTFKDPHTYRIQKTLRCSASFSGIGLHTGKKSRIEILPAAPNTGIVFEKANARSKYTFPAHYGNVHSTAFATTLSENREADSVIFTVEHLMSALYALGVSNALIRVDGPEIPILDGSAKPFVEAMLDAGLVAQPFTVPTIKVLKPIRTVHQGVVCELLPRENLRLTTSIEFEHPAIGLQIFALEVTPQAYIDEVCASRTFGFMKDVDSLRSKNLAQGASVENVVVFDDTGVVNKEGTRFHNECVRHKLLDALGDLALSAARIEGELVSYRGGHSIHIALLNCLSSMRTSWEWNAAEPLSPMGHPEQTESSQLPTYATASHSSLTLERLR